MKEMLIRRHLSPMYGGKTALAPEKKDYLVMERSPEIFISGHVHGVGSMDYHGVKTINASAWQSQTEYQKMHNFNPEPAVMPTIHLGTGRVNMNKFM
jgi:DNA polymerase II small subunit